MADQVLPAKAEKQTKEMQARGQAAFIEETGKAKAEVLKMMTEAWLMRGKMPKISS